MLVSVISRAKLSSPNIMMTLISAELAYPYGVMRKIEVISSSNIIPVYCTTKACKVIFKPMLSCK